MTQPLDIFEARFSTAPDRGVRFLLDAQFLAPLLSSPLREQIGRVARLPYVVGPIVAHPDVSAKPFGFPAGIAVATQPGWFYPLSAPDMGCGYLVLDTGIEVDPDRIKPDILLAAYDRMVRHIGVGSAARPEATVRVHDVLTAGLGAAGPPEHFSTADAEAEESNSWSPDTALLDPDFINGTLRRSLGSASGHFVACYVVERRLLPSAPPVGRIIVVVHVGAAPIRDHLNRRGLFLELAQEAAHSGISTQQDAAAGLFAVDLDTKLGAQVLGVAMASRNFGYVNRQLVADRVLKALTAVLATQVVTPAAQLRHVDHTAFELVSDAIRSRRGLQPLHADRPVFITGDEHTHAYLCHTGGNGAVADGLCCHGIPIRDSISTPPTVWARADLDLAPGRLRDWADTMIANSEFNNSRFWAGSASLEGVIGQLAAADVARPAARLRQLINYREMSL